MNMYYIAIVLPAELDEKVLHWKRYMLEKYKCKVGVKSPAHITIIPPFWMEKNKEEQLLSDVDKIARGIHPFLLQTDNFSAFRPKTIFIALKESEPLANVKNEAELFFSSNEFYDIKKENRAFHPHITIATRDLYKKDFYEAWTLFEKETFLEEWMAEGISVLRHNTRNWDVIHTAPFSKTKETITINSL